MKTVNMQESDLYSLLENVINYVIDYVQKQALEHNKYNVTWISQQSAMKLLQISSLSTLLKIRSKSNIRYTKLSNKIVLYDKSSILDFLNDCSNQPY